MGTGARRDEDSVARFSRSSNFRYNHQRISLHERSAPLAQLDRASGYEPEGREFESLRAHHILFSKARAFDLVDIKNSVGLPRPSRGFAKGGNPERIRNGSLSGRDKRPVGSIVPALVKSTRTPHPRFRNGRKSSGALFLQQTPRGSSTVAHNSFQLSFLLESLP